MNSAVHQLGLRSSSTTIWKCEHTHPRLNFTASCLSWCTSAPWDKDTKCVLFNNWNFRSIFVFLSINPHFQGTRCTQRGVWVFSTWSDSTLFMMKSPGQHINCSRCKSSSLPVWGRPFSFICQNASNCEDSVTKPTQSVLKLIYLVTLAWMGMQTHSQLIKS